MNPSNYNSLTSFYVRRLMDGGKTAEQARKLVLERARLHTEIFQGNPFIVVKLNDPKVQRFEEITQMIFKQVEKQS